MRGEYRIVRENTAGDRSNAAKIDIEGLLAGTDALRVAMDAADDLLLEGGTYRVTVIHDDGWGSRRVATRIAGRPWRVE